MSRNGNGRAKRRQHNRIPTGPPPQSSRSQPQLLRPHSDGALALAEPKRNALNALTADDLKGGASQQWQNWPLNQAGKPIPEMPSEPHRLPETDLFGASGTAIFSGIITTDEYNPDLLSPIDRSNVYDQMRRNHAPIKALLKLIAQPILRADWKVEPGTDDDAGQEIASFVDTALFHELSYETTEGATYRQTWDEILRHVLLMYAFGFVGFELGYRIQDGWTLWSKWTPLLPRTIWRWWVGADNELAGIQQWTFKSWSYQFVNIPAWKLLLFAYDQEGNNYEGISVLRAAYKHWMYVQNYEKIDAIAIERQAVMPPVTKIPENYTAKDVVAAQTISQSIRANEFMGITIPNTWDIEMLRSHGHQQTQILPSIQYHNSMILEAAMAGWVGLGQGPGATGTYALADILVKVFEQTLQADMKLIEQRINGAIRRLVDYNFEDVEVYPQLKAGKVSLTDVAGMAQGIQQLVQAQVIHPTPELEEALLDGLGLPKGSPSVVTGTNPTDPNTPPQPENPDTAGQTDESEPTPDNQSAQAAAAGGPQGGGGGAGQGGGALSESAMLSEVMAAIHGRGDVVERGYVFVGGHQRGYQQNRGPGGKWGPGNGPSEGEGGGGGPRGGGGASRSGGGGGGRGRGGAGSGSGKGSTRGARASRAPKSEEEKAAAKAQRAQAAKAKAETAARAKGQAEASGTGGARSGAAGGKAGKAEAAPKESIHERSARLQQEVNPNGPGPRGADGRLRAEAKPGEELQLQHAPEPRTFDPSAPVDVHQLIADYGEHQLGNALTGYSLEKLRAAGVAAGYKGSLGRTPAEAVSRLTAFATGGRYSANFPKAEGATRASGSRASRATKAEGTTMRAARQPKAAQQQEVEPTPQRTMENGRMTAQEHATWEGQDVRTVTGAARQTYNAFAKLNPYHLQAVYGTGQLHAALHGYSLGKLREAAGVAEARIHSMGHPEVHISGRSKAALEQSIVDNVTAYPSDPFFGG